MDLMLSAMMASLIVCCSWITACSAAMDARATAHTDTCRVVHRLISLTAVGSWLCCLAEVHLQKFQHRNIGPGCATDVMRLYPAQMAAVRGDRQNAVGVAPQRGEWDCRCRCNGVVLRLQSTEPF